MPRKMLLEGPGCVCEEGAANLVSMEWLTSQPSLLLWADTILVSQTDYDYICAGSFEKNDPALSETYAFFFEKLSDEGLISTFDPAKAIPHKSIESVRDLVIADLERYGTASEMHEDGLMTPSMIEAHSGSFCAVALENIYTSLLASRLLGCSCLMDDYKAAFVEERFKQYAVTSTAAASAFNEMYSILVPELNPHQSHQLFCREPIRNNCANGEDCLRNMHKNISRFIDDILLMRSKSEIQGLSSLIERIELEKPEADSSSISRAAIKDIGKAQKRLLNAYPSIKQWTRIIGEASTMMVGIALTSSESSLITPIALTAAIGSLTASAAIETKINTDKWKIAYIDNRFST